MHCGHVVAWSPLALLWAAAGTAPKAAHKEARDGRQQRAAKAKVEKPNSAAAAAAAAAKA